MIEIEKNILDTKELEEAIENANLINAEELIKISADIKNEFIESLEEAKNIINLVINKEEVKQEDIDLITDRLINAINAVIEELNKESNPGEQSKPEEGNKPAEGTNPGQQTNTSTPNKSIESSGESDKVRNNDELPNTGGMPTSSIALLGVLTSLFGGFMIKKRIKNKE